MRKGKNSDRENEPVVHEWTVYSARGEKGLADINYNPTEFAYANEPWRYILKNEPVEIGAIDDNRYSFGGTEYVCIEKSDADGSAPSPEYRWSADRSAFYPYADTVPEGRLYSMSRPEDSECWIWRASDNTEYILVRVDSPLANSVDFGIDDFAAAFINRRAVMWASYLENVVDLHFSGEKDGVKVRCSDSSPFDEPHEYCIQLVYKRLPELRYMMKIYVSDKNGSVAVFNRGAESFLVCDEAGIIPEWFYKDSGTSTN